MGEKENMEMKEKIGSEASLNEPCEIAFDFEIP